MNYSRLLISILSLLPLASSANIIHMQKWRHKDTGQEVILAGDIHVNSIDEKQMSEIDKLVKSGWHLFIEHMPEFDNPDHPCTSFFLRVSDTLLKEPRNGIGSLVDSLEGLIPKVTQTMCHSTNSQAIDCRIWMWPYNFYTDLVFNSLRIGKSDEEIRLEYMVFARYYEIALRKSFELLKSYQETIDNLPSSDAQKEALIDIFDAIGESYDKIRKDTNSLWDKIDTSQDTEQESHWYQFGLLLKKWTFFNGDGNWSFGGIHRALGYDVFDHLMELNILLNLLKNSSPGLVLCGDMHVQNLTTYLPKLGYVLEKEISKGQEFEESLKQRDDLVERESFEGLNIDEYCIDIAQFLAD